ncbi:ScbA/BarX family gamma-butyrolactone biosynthesis protein [Catellatospora tritici]|uniref:ScbA/BarX family gamma-butyrolactone biosynthesis protein n=1 Tax=Catellatospora tritici TaxID=2851566 RepID=UPI001C2DE311|nr:ScbA/BarX family gamma-butyrolactone biosynthesis protein [Catellatospora tritici]MBV1855606.1 hypothetical protein [Catellatospora tritici]
MPRQLVHRAAVSEVLLTDWRSDQDARFAVGAQWPRGHGFFHPIGRRWHDPMIVAETIRQATMLMARTKFAVPEGHQFVMHALAFHVRERGLILADAPTDVVVEVTGHDVDVRGKELRGMRATVRLIHRDSLVGEGQTRFTCLSPAVYRRLRGDAGRPPHQGRAQEIEPELVGRHRAQDVVLARHDDPHSWWLQVDPDHPVFYDHPVDHVPGMAVLEAMRQAAHLATGSGLLLPLSLAAVFHRYIEFDQPCEVRAHAGTPDPEGGEPVRIEVVQQGLLCAEGTLTIRSVG